MVEQKTVDKTNKVSTTTNEKVERKDSFTYALKSMQGLIEKLERNQWATADEIVQMKDVYKGMAERFIGLNMFK